MTSNTIQVWISVEDEVNDDERDRLQRQIYSELKEADIGQVELIHSQATPVGGKGVAGPVSEILVKIAEGGGIAGLISLLSNWLTRDHHRTIKLQIGENALELSGLNRKEQADLVDWFKSQTGFMFTR